MQLLVSYWWIIVLLWILWASRSLIARILMGFLVLCEILLIMAIFIGTVVLLFKAQWLNAIYLFISSFIGYCVSFGVRSMLAAPIVGETIKIMGAGTANQVSGRSNLDIEMTKMILEDLCKSEKIERIELKDKSILYRSLAADAENGDNLIKSDIEIQLD